MRQRVHVEGNWSRVRCNDFKGENSGLVCDLSIYLPTLLLASSTSSGDSKFKHSKETRLAELDISSETIEECEKAGNTVHRFDLKIDRLRAGILD